MKKIFSVVFCFFVLLFSAGAQTNFSHSWSRSLSNSQILGGSIEAFAIATDVNGNTYITGTFTATADFDPDAGVANLTSAGSNDIFIARYDINGNYVFANRLGGTGVDRANDIALDVSGNIYITGTFTATADFDPGAGVANLTSAGNNDVFIAKYDPNGNYLFAGSMGSSAPEDCKKITIDPAGNIYIGGYFQNTVDFDMGAGVANLTSPSGLDGFIAKYNSSGAYIYAKSISGASDERLNSIAVDASGNLCVSGHFNGTTDFDPGAGTATLVSSGLDDIFIAKYDVNGNYVFAKRIGGADYEQSFGMAVDGSGNMLITGWFRTATVDFDPGAGTANITSAGADDAFLAKYDASGNYLFARALGGTNFDQGRNIIVDASDNIFITGEFSGTVDFDPGPGTANMVVSSYGIYIAKYDAGGNYQYAVGVGSSMRGNDLAVDGNGNVFATGMISTTVDFDPGAGTANLTVPSSLQNTFVASYNSIGAYRYAGAIGGYSNTFYSEQGNKIVKDAAGNIYIAGVTQGTVDFDPGPGIANLGSSAVNIYFAKYDADGNYVFAKILFSGWASSVKGMTLDASGNIYIAGNFSGYIDVDPGAGSAYLSASGGQDVFFAKYDANGNYVYGKSIGGTIHDQAGGLAMDALGNLYIGGHFTGTVDFDPGVGVVNLAATASGDGFIAKYDANGNYVYAKKLGATPYVTVEGIALDATANLIVTGRLNGTADFDPGAATVNLTSAGRDDVFIAKYTSSGNYVFAKRMGSTGHDYGFAIAVDPGGNLAITGGFSGTVDFDPGAGTANLMSGGGNDIYIAKYDGSGNYVFAKSFAGGASNDFGWAIAFDASGNVYATGDFSGTADFDGGPGTANLASAGGQDIFITRYDPAGNYGFAKSIGGTSGDYGFDILADGSGNVFVTGGFQNTADFDPNANSALQTSLNSGNIFFAKYTQCTSASIALTGTPAASTTISGTTALTDGGCALLTTITPNGANPVTGTINATVWIEPSVPTHAGQPFVARHYEITPSTNASTATAMVTLYFTQQEFNDFNAHAGSILDLPTGSSDATGKANLRVAKYSGTSNDGSGLPGTYTGTAEVINPDDADIIWNSTLNRWEIGFNATGFSGFIVQTSTTILPLTLLDFSARLVSDNAMLTWKTENEINTLEFIVERSTDGRNYHAVGTVASANTEGIHQYSFTDPNITSLNAAIVYYRLKQKDIDGRFTYSKIVALSMDNNKNLILFYPNPVVNDANLTITIKKPEQVCSRIIDNSGRVVRQQQWNLSPGSASLSVDIKGLANGMYYLELKGESINYRKQFVKQ